MSTSNCFTCGKPGHFARDCEDGGRSKHFVIQKTEETAAIIVVGQVTLPDSALNPRAGKIRAQSATIVANMATSRGSVITTNLRLATAAREAGTSPKTAPQATGRKQCNVTYVMSSATSPRSARANDTA